MTRLGSVFREYMMPEPELIWAALAVAVIMAIYQYLKARRNAFDEEREQLLTKHLPANEPNVQKIFKIKDCSMYVAVGYGETNSTLIEGPRGNILVNTGSSSTADALQSAFSYVSEQPTKAVVITRQLDETSGGLDTFTDDGQQVTVYAHEESKLRTVFKSVSARKEVEICGLKIELIPCPAETSDQIMLYWPDKAVLITSGSYAEKHGQWQFSREMEKSLNYILDELTPSPRVLVTQWGKPILGREPVREALIVWKQNLRK